MEVTSVKIYRFEVYNSMTLHLYIALCAQVLWSFPNFTVPGVVQMCSLNECRCSFIVEWISTPMPWKYSVKKEIYLYKTHKEHSMYVWYDRKWNPYMFLILSLSITLSTLPYTYIHVFLYFSKPLFEFRALKFLLNNYWGINAKCVYSEAK